MKNSLTLIPVFFLNLLLWLVFCPFFYSLAQPETFYALADGKYAFFFGNTLQKALDFLPAAAVLAFSAVFVFLVRNKVKKAAGFFVFCGIFLLTLAVLEPAAVRLKFNLQNAETESFAERAPEAGLIQETAPNLKAVMLENAEGNAGVVLATAKISGNSSVQNLTIYSGENAVASELNPFLSGFNPEILQKLEAPAFLKRLSDDADVVHSTLSKAAENSITAYLWTGGAFFALAASFFFLCVLTDWKLINFLLYALALRALYRLFPLLHGEQCISFLRRFLPQGFPDAALSALPALLLAAVITVLGFALILPRYAKRNQGDNFL